MNNKIICRLDIIEDNRLSGKLQKFITIGIPGLCSFACNLEDDLKETLVEIVENAQTYVKDGAYDNSAHKIINVANPESKVIYYSRVREHVEAKNEAKEVGAVSKVTNGAIYKIKKKEE